MTVVTTAITTSSANISSSRIPVSRPIERMTSSVRPRVFMSTPMAAARWCGSLTARAPA
jgi:hypothetical protein